MLENFTNRQTVEVTFEKMDNCDGSGNIQPGCELLHKFEDWAQVIKIK